MSILLGVPHCKKSSLPFSINVGLSQQILEDLYSFPYQELQSSHRYIKANPIFGHKIELKISSAIHRGHRVSPIMDNYFLVAYENHFLITLYASHYIWWFLDLVIAGWIFILERSSSNIWTMWHQVWMNNKERVWLGRQGGSDSGLLQEDYDRECEGFWFIPNGKVVWFGVWGSCHVRSIKKLTKGGWKD
jgi:hypothetical protein